MHDLIIIGAGPAGLTAGLYAGRARLKTVILEAMAVGGQMTLTASVENFPGFPGEIRTAELIERLTKQVNDSGVTIENAQIKTISPSNNFSLLDVENKEYRARSLIIASGAQPKKIGVAGEEKLAGRGVSYCAVCDGPLFREKDIVVVGGGDRAVEEALFLSRFAKSIKLIHRRGSLRATQILQEHLRQDKKIAVIWDTIAEEIIGDKRVEAVKTRNVKTQQETSIKCDGVFVAIGVLPNTGFLNGFIKTDDAGYILTDDNLTSSREGVFACGDCRKRPFLQIITACAEGALAAFSADKYLQLHKIKREHG